MSMTLSVWLTCGSSKKTLDCGNEVSMFYGQYWWTSVLVREEGAAASYLHVHLDLTGWRSCGGGYRDDGSLR